MNIFIFLAFVAGELLFAIGSFIFIFGSEEDKVDGIGYMVAGGILVLLLFMALNLE